jgi:hypothetical protein
MSLLSVIEIVEFLFSDFKREPNLPGTRADRGEARELWRAIASFLKGVSKEECNAYLANSGYT